MGMVVLASVKGAPGVTTTALALASAWPEGRQVVLAELDPAGGDLPARFGLPPEPGLLSLAAAVRHTSALTHPGVLAEHCQQLPGGLLVLVAPAPGEARLALDIVAPLLPALARDLGADLVIDLGRLESATLVPSGGVRVGNGHPASDPVSSLLSEADRCLIVVRNELGDLAHVAAALPRLQSLAPQLALLLVDSGPYSPAEVAGELGVEVLGAVPSDRSAATVLGGGAHVGRLSRLPLLRAAAALAETLSSELVSARGPHANRADDAPQSATVTAVPERAVR